MDNWAAVVTHEDQRRLLTTIELFNNLSDESLEEAKDGVVLSQIFSRNENNIQKIFHLERFSNLSKALRVTALVGKFISKQAKAVGIKRRGECLLNVGLKFSSGSHITADDMNLAEKVMRTRERRHGRPST